MNFGGEFWRYFWHRAHPADKGRLVGILGAVPWLEEGGSWQCWGFPGLAQQMVLWSSHLGFYKPKVKFFMLRILLLYKLWLQGDKYCLRGWKCVFVCVCVCASSTGRWGFTFIIQGKRYPLQRCNPDWLHERVHNMDNASPHNELPQIFSRRVLPGSRSQQNAR